MSILLFLFPRWIKIVEGKKDKNWFLMVIAVIKNAKWCPQLRARERSEDGTLNLPELEGDWVISGSRPRILQMEKSVRDLLETGAKDGSPTENLIWWQHTWPSDMRVTYKRIHKGNDRFQLSTIHLTELITFHNWATLSEESFGTATLFMALHIPSNKASGPTNILFIDPHGYSLRGPAAVLLKDLKPIQGRSRYSLTN